MTEAWMRELGLSDQAVEAILERLREHDAELMRGAEAELSSLRAEKTAMEERAHTRRREHVEAAIAKAGFVSRVGKRMAQEELMAGDEDPIGYLEALRASEPSLFDEFPIPLYAGALSDSEEEEREEVPFYYLHERHSGQRGKS